MQIRLRILFAVLALVGLAAAPTAAIDFGGSLGNTTDVTVPSEGDTTLGQANRLSLFVSHAFSDAWEIRGRARYEYRLESVFADDTDTDVDWWRGDLDSLYVRGRVPQAEEAGYLVDMRFGRIRLREFSGALLRERADGLRVAYQRPAVDLEFQAGYTGLLMKESSTLLLSNADVLDDSDEDVYLAPPRLLGVLGLSLPELFARQTVDVSLVGQMDLREQVGEGVGLRVDRDLPDSEGPVHSAYGGLGVGGPVVSSLFYDVYGYYGWGLTTGADNGDYEETMIHSFLGGANLQYFIPQAAQSVVEAGYVFSSGDSDYQRFYEGNTDGTGSKFVGLSASSFGAVFSPRLGNLMVGRASYSIKPFANSGTRWLEELQTGLRGFGFFRPTDGPISEGGLNPDSDERYLGAEVDLVVNFRPFSDLGFSLVNGVFLPNAGNDAAFSDEVVGTEYKGSLTMTFSF